MGFDEKMNENIMKYEQEIIEAAIRLDALCAKYGSVVATGVATPELNECFANEKSDLIAKIKAACAEIQKLEAPAVDTAPAAETAPAVETAPAAETAPAVETAPATVAVPTRTAKCCTYCGDKLLENSVFCVNCGKRVANMEDIIIPTPAVETAPAAAPTPAPDPAPVTVPTPTPAVEPAPTAPQVVEGSACPKCGAPLLDDAVFCINCGTRI